MLRLQFKFAILKFALKSPFSDVSKQPYMCTRKRKLCTVCVGRSRQCDKRYSKRMLLTRADKFRHKTRWGKSKYV